MKTFYEMLQILESGSSFNYETDNLDDLIAAIHRLPDTIEYISVHDRFDVWDPGRRVFAPRDVDLGTVLHPEIIKGDPDWRGKAESTLRNAKAKTKKDDWDTIDKMFLRGHKGGGPTDSFITYLSSPIGRGFNQAMHGGAYGPLD